MKSVRGGTGRQRRHKRLRKKIAGTAVRPRLCVMVSNRHLYVQLVDDERGVTLTSATTAGKQGDGKKNVEAAQRLGRMMAERVKEKGIQAVVFDRGGFLYHGRVKALADALREAGIRL